jgi:uncharacterized protein
MMMFDPMYFIIAAPGLVLSLYAMFKLKSTYAKYAEVPQSKGMTGAEVARAILDHEGLRNVAIEQCPGELTDHYDPRHRVLRLSHSNFDSSSLSAIGVAAHEAGHAIQHKEKYAPLEARMAIVGVTNIGSNLGVILFGIGTIVQGLPFLMTLGIWLFSAVVVFQLITLPVEYDASARAKRVLANLGFVSAQEGIAIRKVLNAAALTYVAALVSAVLQLLYMIMRANSRRD